MSLEVVLHKIVNHLPIAPYQKDELLADVTAEFAEDEVEDDDAEE